MLYRGGVALQLSSPQPGLRPATAAAAAVVLSPPLPHLALQRAWRAFKELELAEQAHMDRIVSREVQVRAEGGREGKRGGHGSVTGCAGEGWDGRAGQGGVRGGGHGLKIAAAEAWVGGRWL